MILAAALTVLLVRGLVWNCPADIRQPIIRIEYILDRLRLQNLVIGTEDVDL